MSIRNISDWTKNMASFPRFENTYTAGTNNTLIYKGGAGYERIYYPVQVVKDVPFEFKLKFCSPSGFYCSYGSDKEYIAILANRPTNTDPLNSNSVIAKTELFSGASRTLEEYVVRYTPTADATVYLVIDFGYMLDDITTDLIYADISAESAYDWQIKDGKIENKQFIELPEKYMGKPYPLALWFVDAAVNNGKPYNGLMPDIRGIDLWSLERKHQIYVYDLHEPQNGFDSNGLAILDPISCTSIHNDERWDVELTHPLDSWGKWKNLLVNNVLKVDGQLFRIDISQPKLSGQSREMYVHAKHITQDMTDMLLLVETFRGGNAEAFIDFCFSKRYNAELPGYEYYRFEGHSDIETICGPSEYINTSVWAAMVGADNSLINRYGGELYRDNFYFSINKRMQYAKDNAFYLRYSLDMTEITQRVDYTEVCTNLMCYDNYGNFSFGAATFLPTSRMHHPVVRMWQFNYSEYEGSKERLDADEKALWERLKTPKITYDVQLAALKNDPRYAEFLNLQNYNYGDTGTIYCPELDITTEQKITEVEKNELTGEITRMILGNLRGSIIRPTYKGSTISSGNSVEDKQNRANQNLIMSQNIAGMEEFTISALEQRTINVLEGS